MSLLSVELSGVLPKTIPTTGETFSDVVKRNTKIAELSRSVEILKRALSKEIALQKLQEIHEGWTEIMGELDWRRLDKESEKNALPVGSDTTSIDDELQKIDQEAAEWSFFCDEYLYPNIVSLQEKPISPDELNRSETKKWISNLFSERGIPERKLGETIDNYLRTLYIHFLRISLATVWNRQNDRSTAPYTSDYHLDALKGPTNPLKLNSHPLVYRATDANTIKDFGSLFDQLVHYFEDEGEKKQVAAFAERLKAQFSEISVLHNRSVVFTKNFDATGPDGSLKALSELARSTGDYQMDFQHFFDRENMTDQEKSFSRAVEFSMSVWSAQLLEKYELDRIRSFMSDRVRKLSDPEHSEYKTEYRVAPWYTSDQSTRERFVEKMISEALDILVEEEVQRRRAKGELVDSRVIDKLRLEYKPSAELAYHIGESFRIGGGLDPFMDVSYVYEYELEPDGVSPKIDPKTGRKIVRGSYAKVLAREGSSKAAEIGLYVDSAYHTEVRPDFNPIFADQLVKGYAPFARTLQLTHNLSFDVSGCGDNRASLIELLSIDGGVEHVDWSSGATNPDQVVLDAATQTINHIWPRASISKSSKPEFSFFIEVGNIPLSTTMILDREDELNQLRNIFGYSGDFVRMMSNLSRRVPLINPKLVSYEVDGFDSDSHPITGPRLQHIKTMYKDVRDYWINAFKADQDRFPMDTIRLMRYLFSRKDRKGGFVNHKIELIISSAVNEMKALPLPLQRKYLKEKFIPQIQGYLNYDLLMRSVFFLLTPDFRTVKAREEIFDGEGKVSSHGTSALYEDLDFTTVEELEVANKGGSRIVNVSQLEFAINQAVELRDLFKGEEISIQGSGYTLYPDTDYRKYTDDSYVLSNPSLRMQAYTRFDVLRMAQEMGLGEGYVYREVSDRRGRRHWQLQRNSNEPTLQYLSDRIVLMMYLFHKEALKIANGKH